MLYINIFIIILIKMEKNNVIDEKTKRKQIYSKKFLY